MGILDIIIFVIFIVASEQHYIGPPEVEVSQGLIRGKISSAEDGTEYFSFLNIPYAKPPVGELRFKDPQPAENWDGVFEAFKEPKVCAQYDTLFTDQELGEEDCLILNVHTPLDSSSCSELLPVMFWVHGGAFIGGSSAESFYGPEYLVKKGVVFVSINYRLGPLGFLNMNTPEVPGNAALKDIAMGLKWVSENIQNFGGDPNKVTVFGESAGSAAVHYLLASPLTKGLIYRAICQSGVTSNPWAVQRNPEEPVQQLTKVLNITSNNSDEILSKLQKLSASEIVRAVPTVLDKHPVYLPFAPTIEKEFPDVDAFITRDPVEIFLDGDYNKCPTILGFNNNEGIIILWRWLKDYFKEDPTPEDFVSDFQRLIPDDIANILSDSEIEKYTERAKKLYFGSSENKLQNYADLTGDWVFIDGINVMANIMVKHSPVYLYNFIYNGGRNVFEQLTSYNYEGASHFDEIGYLFHMLFFDEKGTNERDRKMMNYIQTLWTDFAKGNTDDCDWIPATKDSLNCLVIDEIPKIVEKPFSTRIYIWEILRRSLKMYGY